MHDEDEEPSALTRVLQTPCYRTSMLFGISSGIISGLGFFLFTSRAKRATHVGLGSYVSATLISWVYCRYQLTKRLIEERRFKAAVQQKILQEGVMNVPQDTTVVKLEDA